MNGVFTPSGYVGYITLRGQEVPIQLEIKEDGVQIYTNKNLTSALSKSELTNIKKAVEGTRDISKVVTDLKELLERHQTIRDITVSHSVEVYTRLISELERLGWHRLISIDDSLSKLELKLTDKKSRNYTITVKLPIDYPNTMPECTAELPLSVDLRWSPKTSSIADILSQYQKVIDSLEELWETLDDIDHNTWVLEPERPTYSTTTRRIALGNHCSLQLTIDVNRPRSVPECRFLGADNAVMQLRDQLNKNLHKWNSSLTVRNNLEIILSVTFPSPKTTKKEDFSMECAICYAYRLENDIPDRVCDNSKCSKAFHRICLYEWLRAIPSTRQSFDTIFGACPYCSTPISVKIS